VAVANLGSPQNDFFDGSVSVLIGKGDGTFQPAIDYATGMRSEFVVVGDFNRDGKPDLVVVNNGSSSVSVHGKPFPFCACIGLCTSWETQSATAAGALQTWRIFGLPVTQRASVLECGGVPPLSSGEPPRL